NNLDLLNTGTESQVVMGDDVAAVNPYFNGAKLRTQRLFRWDAMIYEPGENAVEMAVPLQNIYSLNAIILEVMNAVDGTEKQKKAVLAEARAVRAYTYFLLINYYGKPYDEGTAATDAGFPIITKADVTETRFTRASVKEVYDFIINDLQAAIPELPARTTHRLRMSTAAAEALLGKVYTFMGKFNEAIPHLNAAFTDLANAFIPLELYDYNVALAPGGIFTPLGIFGPAYPQVDNNTENLYAKQFINMWSFVNSELVMDAQTVALFESSDLRLKFYSRMPFPAGPSYPAGMLRRTGPPASQYGVVLPDLYLLRAECKARMNDLAAAKKDVEALRSKRMPLTDAAVPSGIASDKDQLTHFILQERIREFALQGFRWFDMRRLSVDPVFKTTVRYTHILYNSSGPATTYTLQPARFVLRFPQKIIDQNPGMQNNP
ncbi:MAG: RagB/SusD family nutrient uptake outer membrane protein, partial [Bacteroidetes bacterium]|nr:RagB/SusD family nutrient uptake outer membrane protein [Bacteroidota bacterium]